MSKLPNIINRISDLKDDLNELADTARKVTDDDDLELISDVIESLQRELNETSHLL